GYTDLALMRIKGTHPEVESDLEQVRKASIRATDLVRQILTFSRRQTREKSPLLISVIIKEAMKLLRASIPTTIDIREEISSQATILADATQLHQLVMNLCTNAYHAMADYSGVLTVTLHDTTLAEGEIIVNNTPIAAGNYVTLSIKDTGTGIPHSVIANIFDPYFTTKEKGKGTGMGLAVVKGIVDSHNGAITVDSEPGQGSIFKVYLPASTAGSGAEKVIDASFSVKLLSTRHERIMVVDDESSLRELAYQFLTAAGYRVDLFANAEEASNALTQNPHAWHLLLTDLTMPGMTGEQLAIKAKQIKPDLPIIICSGDIQSLTNKEIAELNTSTCLQKPI
ncbi:MAG: ATP-binding protein, partial [Desulfobulbaceae bacterium]|nr:ATP-binding protein [Desulfobulbaceae bacterium]